MGHKGILVVVSGFSGAGKGTVMKELVNRYDNYALSVSMTTREMRPGETEGVSYFFVDRSVFEQAIAQDGLIEYASYCGNYYGTPKRWVQEQLDNGKDVILEIEIQGALKVREKFPEALLLFVMPPSAEELMRRLTARGTETKEAILRRMERAVQESEGIENYDYIVMNDKLEDCVAQMHAMIAMAHSRPGQKREFIAGMRAQLGSLVKGEK